MNCTQEIRRKLIHLSSLWIPASIWWLEKTWALTLLAASWVLVVLFELVRRRDGRFGQLAHKTFGRVLRPSELGERKRLTGAFYMLLGAFFTALLFPVFTAVCALTILMVSDSAAALIGKRFGQHPLAGKTLEGCLAFFVSALTITWVFGVLHDVPFLSYGIVGGGACFVATLAELFAPKLKLDDNLFIPLAFATTHSALSTLLTLDMM